MSEGDSVGDHEIWLEHKGLEADASDPGGSGQPDHAKSNVSERKFRSGAARTCSPCVLLWLSAEDLRTLPTTQLQVPMVSLVLFSMLRYHINSGGMDCACADSGIGILV